MYDKVAAFLTLNRKFYPIDNSARNCRQWLENPGCLWTGQKVWELDVLTRTCQDKLHQVHVERRRFSSLNRSRAIILSRSNCVAKFIAHRVSNTHSVISLNVTDCKYREVWWLCVSQVYVTPTDSDLTQRLPWQLWLWLRLFIFWNTHCVKSAECKISSPFEMHTV